MKKRILAIVLSFVMVFSIAIDVICLDTRAETILSTQLAQNSGKKGIVIEDITAELTTNKKDIEAAEKIYGEKLTEGAVLLKTVIYARNHFSTPIYEVAFQLDYLVADINYQANNKLYRVNSAMVYSDNIAVNAGNVFTATGYKVIDSVNQLCQLLHIEQLYFKDTKTADVWIMAVPTESPVFEYDNYKTVVNKMMSESQPINSGDIVTFGSYEQNNNRSKMEPIEWIVLGTDGTKVLLLSRYALDSQPFHSEYSSVLWEKSSLRKWLNKQFYKMAFTDEEKTAVLETHVDNGWRQGNTAWEGKEGTDTADKVFLLSYQEVEAYLDKKEKICEPTAYAVKMGADVKKLDDGFTEAGCWWLRSVGEKEHHAAYINFEGKCFSNAVGNKYLTVRPAMWVDIDKLDGQGIKRVEPADMPYSAVVDAIQENLPILTYAISDTQKVYSYSDAALTKKSTDYYLNAYNDEIVIMDVSEDGNALYIRYPSTTSGTGYRDRWFAAEDILGSIDPDVFTYEAVAKSNTYSLKYNMRAMYGKIFKGQMCHNLGTCATGDRVVIYPLTSSKTVLDIIVSQQMALISS